MKYGKKAAPATKATPTGTKAYADKQPSKSCDWKNPNGKK